MNKFILAIYVFFSLFKVISAYLGIDVSTDVYETPLTCLKNAGYSRVVMRCYQSTGNVDPNAIHTIYNAIAVDYSSSDIDVYMFPCPLCGTTAKEQVDAAINNLVNNNAPFNMFWLDIEDTSTHAYWGTNYANSQSFMIALLIESVNRLGRSRVGVYSSYYMWGLVFNDVAWDCCSAYALWYANYDGAENFNDFSSFGGWSTPTMKQYAGSATVCSTSVDLNYFSQLPVLSAAEQTTAQQNMTQPSPISSANVVIPLWIFEFMIIFIMLSL